jgi:hypothetical protein
MTEQHQRPVPCSSANISIPLAEMVREEGIAFPPCFRDFFAPSATRQDKVV